MRPELIVRIHDADLVGVHHDPDVALPKILWARAGVPNTNPYQSHESVIDAIEALRGFTVTTYLYDPASRQHIFKFR